MDEEKKVIKKNTIKDIADMAGTSKTTVSFYLNGKFEKMSEETKNKIEKVIETTGYTPSLVARALTSKRSNLVGIIVGDIASPFSMKLIKGIESVLKEKGFQIIVVSSKFSYKDERESVVNMINVGVDGFIVQPSINFTNIIKLIEDNNKKIVLVDSINAGYTGRWVQTDNFYSTKRSIDKLVSKGFNNFILATEDPSMLAVRMERKMALEVTCADCKVNYNYVVISKEMTEQEINSSLQKYILVNKKNAIFCINGYTTQRVFDSINRYSKHMLREIGIMGFDKYDWMRYATPKISNIEQPLVEEGKYAAELIMEAVNGKVRKPSKVFESKVNFRESTET